MFDVCRRRALPGTRRTATWLQRSVERSPFDSAQGKLIGGYRTDINAACYRDAIRDSRIASFVARIRFASGISNSLKVAVVSAGWRSLDDGAIVRGASLNAISSLLGNEKWGLIKYLTLIS